MVQPKIHIFYFNSSEQLLLVLNLQLMTRAIYRQNTQNHMKPDDAHQSNENIQTKISTKECLQPQRRSGLGTSEQNCGDLAVEPGWYKSSSFKQAWDQKLKKMRKKIMQVSLHQTQLNRWHQILFSLLFLTVLSLHVNLQQINFSLLFYIKIISWEYKTKTNREPLQFTHSARPQLRQQSSAPMKHHCYRIPKLLQWTDTFKTNQSINPNKSKSSKTATNVA